MTKATVTFSVKLSVVWVKMGGVYVTEGGGGGEGKGAVKERLKVKQFEVEIDVLLAQGSVA